LDFEGFSPCFLFPKKISKIFRKIRFKQIKLYTNLAEKAGKSGCAVASEAVQTIRTNVGYVVARGSVFASESAVCAKNRIALNKIRKQTVL
jgi:hypothetical protein